jgi:hypothetical protein
VDVGRADPGSVDEHDAFPKQRRRVEDLDLSDAESVPRIPLFGREPREKRNEGGARGRLPGRLRGRASHFSREYKRLFGEPPIRDIERLRHLATA